MCIFTKNYDKNRHDFGLSHIKVWWFFMYIIPTQIIYVYQMFKGDLPREHDADVAKAPHACAWLVRHTTTAD